MISSFTQNKTGLRESTRNTASAASNQIYLPGAPIFIAVTTSTAATAFLCANFSSNSNSSPTPYSTFNTSCPGQVRRTSKFIPAATAVSHTDNAITAAAVNRWKWKSSFCSTSFANDQQHDPLIIESCQTTNYFHNWAGTAIFFPSTRPVKVFTCHTSEFTSEYFHAAY